MTDKQKKHIAKIIERELGFTNGWSINEKSYTEYCLIAAKKIDRYLSKGLKIQSTRNTTNRITKNLKTNYVIRNPVHG